MRIVCYGDSLTACGGKNGKFSDILQERFPGHEFINKGFNGWTIEEARANLQKEVLLLSPDLVLLEFGANDWWRASRHYQSWAADLDAMLTKIKKSGAQAVVMGVFGAVTDPLTGTQRNKKSGADERSEAFAKLEKEIAEKHNCPYIANHQVKIINDRCCWIDENHPNELGNRKIADTIQKVLEELLGIKAKNIRKSNIENVRDFWDEAVQEAADKLAVVCGERRLSFAEADEQVRRIAAAITRHSRNSSPRIAVCLPNCLEFFLIYWATLRLGGIVVPINPWLKKESLKAIFSSVNADILFLKNKTENKDLLAAAEEFPEMPMVFLDEKKAKLTFKDFLKKASFSAHPEISSGSAAIIMHTSGTTAAPKGAVMLHRDLIFNAMTTIKAQDFSCEDVHLMVNPMFHCTALYSSLPVAAYQKTPLIISAETQPKELLELIAKENITTFLTVPTVLQRIVDWQDNQKYNTKSLRVIGYAGSFMPVKTLRKLQELFPNTDLHNFFGLTETISATHVLNAQEVVERPDSIGKLLPFVDAIILNENGALCAANEIGELLFARENVISTYWNNDALLREALHEYRSRIWFRTGDLAMQDEEGFFFIKGRKKDMIIVGGENVFSAEVENVLLNMPGIREVAVKGIPATGIRESLGELIKAYIVLEDNSTVNEMIVKRYCHQNLPSYKIPHEIKFLPELPRNPSGKIMKNELD